METTIVESRAAPMARERNMTSWYAFFAVLLLSSFLGCALLLHAPIWLVGFLVAFDLIALSIVSWYVHSAWQGRCMLVAVNRAEITQRQAYADMALQTVRLIEGARENGDNIKMSLKDGLPEMIEIIRAETMRQRKYQTHLEEEDQEKLDASQSSVPQLTSGRRGPVLAISPHFQPEPNQILGKRKLLVGVSGSGKSNSVGVYVEELGPLEVPLLLADTEDEYASLCDPRWLPLGVIAGKHVREFYVTTENAEQFGRYLIENTLQVILNLQSYEMEEGAMVLTNIIAGMREWEQERESETRVPCEVLLEEATTWLPQNIKESPIYGKRALDELQNAFFNDMVRKGRKRGLGLTAICQKIAEIDKRVLQSDLKILHRQTEQIDLEKYQKLGISSDETLSLLDGEAFIFSSTVSKLRTRVRMRHSKHGAETPGLEHLRRYQQSRNHFDSRNRTEIFEQPLEPFQNISEFPRTSPKSAKNPYEGIPEPLIPQIQAAYEKLGYKNRTQIRDQLNLNGDQYWMIRVVCDEVDAKRA